MQKEELRTILLDQKEEIGKIRKQKAVRRKIEKEARKALKDNSIKVIIGVRRSGKSFLAHRILKDKNYAYVNFDDERLISLKTKNLNDVLETLQEINPGFKYLLLDEIQNIVGWELFVNRLQRQGYNVVVTGSNAKLLSKELATHLTGRHIALELYPFSFQEFLSYQNVDLPKGNSYSTSQKARLKRFFNKYFQLGGFPEIFKREFQDRYWQDLFNKIITQDIITRYSIRQVRDFKEIALYVLSNFSSRITYHKIKNIFEFKSVHTIKNYLDYLEEAYLIFQVYPFSFKFKEQIKSARKAYGIDQGLIQAVSSTISDNRGPLLENMVFLELKRRQKEVYFYHDSLGHEIDFVIKNKNKIEQLIQVCYDASKKETQKRETRSLIRNSQKLQCSNLLVVTQNEEKKEVVKDKVIHYIPFWKWAIE